MFTRRAFFAALTAAAAAPVWGQETEPRFGRFLPNLDNRAAVLALDGDANYAAIGYESGGIDLVNLRQTVYKFTAPAHARGPVNGVAFAPDGKTFASAG